MKEGIIMLSELTQSQKVAGVKQTLRALKAGNVTQVFVALDADPAIRGKVVYAAKASDIPVTEVNTMKKLGFACGLDVGTATAAIIRK